MPRRAATRLQRCAYTDVAEADARMLPTRHFPVGATDFTAAARRLAKHGEAAELEVSRIRASRRVHTSRLECEVHRPGTSGTIWTMSWFGLFAAALLISGAEPRLAQTDTTHRPEVRYFGQLPPGITPVRFAPGVVSTKAIEINGVFRQDFREFFFARQIDGVFALFRSTLAGDRWSDAQALRIFPGGGSGVAVDMAYSSNGQELYFLGRFKPDVPPREAPLDIWVTRQRDGHWATAQIVPAGLYAYSRNRIYLERTNFGEEYLRYKKSVRRWL